MAQSIFDGTIPDGEYEYKVFKISQNKYILIAFDIKKILKQLKDLNIDIKFIDRIYTAQSEFLKDEISFKIDEEFGLVSVEGVLVKMPVKLFTTDVDIDRILLDKKLSSNYIYSGSLQKTDLKQKDFKLLLFLLLLINIFLVSSAIIVKKEIYNVNLKKEDFVDKNSLPATVLQIKSMEEELKAIDNIQSAIRKGIDYLAQFKLLKDEYFVMLRYDGKKLLYKIKFKERKRQRKFKSYLSKYKNSIVEIGEAK